MAGEIVFEQQECLGDMSPGMRISRSASALQKSMRMLFLHEWS